MLVIDNIQKLATRSVSGWWIISASKHPLSDEWYEIKLTKDKDTFGSIRIHRISDNGVYRCGVWLNDLELHSFNAYKSILSNRDEFLMYCVGELEKRVR